MSSMSRGDARRGGYVLGAGCSTRTASPRRSGRIARASPSPATASVLHDDQDPGSGPATFGKQTVTRAQTWHGQVGAVITQSRRRGSGGWTLRSRVRNLVHPVLNRRSRQNPAFPDKNCLVQPRVSFIAGF